MRNTTELIGTKEASELLGIDRTGVIRRVAAGELTPVQKLPGTRGAYIFDRSDVMKLRDVSWVVEAVTPTGERIQITPFTRFEATGEPGTERDAS